MVEPGLHERDVSGGISEGATGLLVLARRFYRLESDAVELACATSLILDSLNTEEATCHHPVGAMAAIVLARLHGRAD
jgi:hypothetical protein